MTELLKFYRIYNRLTRSQKQCILKQLQAKGHDVSYIQAKQYTPGSSVGTHFFFYRKGNKEPERYWEIPAQMWKDFMECLSEYGE